MQFPMEQLICPCLFGINWHDRLAGDLTIFRVAQKTNISTKLDVG